MTRSSADGGIIGAADSLIDAAIRDRLGAGEAGPTAVHADVRLGPTAWAFVQDRTADVLLLEGPRREGKTVSALVRILRVAHDYPAAQPIRVACVRDTWTNLSRTVIDTIRQGAARGWWDATLSEQDTQVSLNDDEAHLYLFGMDRPADANKFQSFEAGILWLEEAAPAADLASGIPVEVFALGISSLSQPGLPCHAILTMNPPDDSHWTVDLLTELEHLGRADLRVRRYWVPPGENRHVPAGYRTRLRAVLEAAGRPDLVQRLVDGQRGSVKLGVAVTPDFVAAQHVAPEPLPLNPRWPTWRSWDFGTCVDERTEILTDEGWKRFAALQPADLVATLHPGTGALEYQRPTRYVQEPFAGELVTYRTNNVDFAVTPQHEIPVWCARGHRGERTVYERRRADHLLRYRNPHATIALTAEWHGSDVGLFGPHKWGADLYARVLGWYLSEGSVSRGRVTIYQHEAHPLLVRTVASTGLRWRRSPAGWTTYDPALAQYLEQCGTSACTRRLPREVLGFSAKTARALLECFIAGDGHYRERGRSAEAVAFTASAGLADDLQALALHAGLHARITPRGPRERTIRDRGGRTHVAHSSGGYVLSFKGLGRKGRWPRRASVYGRHFGRHPYQGMVYCVTVPNGIIYVRRNGIAHWTGNSPACVLAQQTPSGHLYVIGALETPEGTAMGIEQFVGQHVLPWQSRFGIITHRRTAREVAFRIRDVGDPAGRSREASNSERSAARSLEALLGTTFESAPPDWPARRDSMAWALRQMIGARRLVQVDPDECKPLVRALGGAWHYHRTPAGVVYAKPTKDQASHIGDAYGYLCAQLYPVADTLRRLARGTDVAPLPRRRERAHSWYGR